MGDTEAKERAEEEQKMGVQIKLVKRRKKMHDFEFPFYDEEDDLQAADSQADFRHIKALYEKQREARAATQEISLSIGLSLFRRLDARAEAREWCYNEAKRIYLEQERLEKERADAVEAAAAKEETEPKGAIVSKLLHDSKRKRIKVSLSHNHKPKKARRTASLKIL